MTSLLPLHALFIFASVMALVSNGLAIWRFSAGRPLRMSGHLTHAGFAIMLLGVIASAAYSGEETVTLTNGESVSSYGADIQFIGAVAGETPEQGYLDLRLVRNGDTSVARPKLYLSEYTQQVMRTPYIETGLLYDVYLAPLDHKASDSHGHALTLIKGQTTFYNGWELTFDRYDMSQHGEGNSMSVGAIIKAQQGGQIYEIAPAMESSLQGKQFVSAKLPGTDMSFSLVGMSVEQKSINIEIADPANSQQAAGGESLVLSISRKPLTSLVWIGCILISIGTGLSYWRRRTEERILMTLSPHAAASPTRPRGARINTTLMK
jgi:cytochrome c-type biogenesis protein CcmF